MRSRQSAIAFVLILAFYLTVVGPRATILIQSHRSDARLIGIAVFALPAIGAWYVWREARFGSAIERLRDELAASGRLAPEVGWAGRRLDPELDPGRFQIMFAARRLEVEAAPDDWAAWYRLGLAYDATGDRRNGRAALRRAVTLSRRADRPV